MIDTLLGAVHTLAISPQLFPASRIAFSLCSSVAVHGVLVRPFFFTPSSVSGVTGGNAAAVGALLDSATSVGLPSAGVEGVSVLGDARRFLEFGGKVSRWVVETAGAVAGGGSVEGGGIRAGWVVGEFDEADSRCRFCGGGDLSLASAPRHSHVSGIEILRLRAQCFE